MAKTANLGSLNFELVMDDAKFNASIQKNLQAAQEMNVSMSNLLNLRQQMAQIAGNTARLEEQVTKTMRNQSSVLKDQNKTIRDAVFQMERYNKERGKMIIGGMPGSSLYSQFSVMSGLTSLALKYVSIWGASSLLKNVVAVTGEFELQRMSLRAMLKDAMQADEVYGKIWDLALKSPFNAKELVTYAKQLAAYSIPVNELYDTTKMLADVSAGLGVGMDRLVLAYGQIRSAEFLRGQEVRQMTEAGIPILEELRKQFVELGEEGITAADVFDKISKRLVPFEMVEKVFKNLTSESGKFYEMQEKQAETLKGKVMILKDAFDKMLNSMGENNDTGLKRMVDGLTNMTRNYEKVLAILKVLLATYGAYRVTLGLVALAQKAITAIDSANYFAQVVRDAKKAEKGLSLLAAANVSLSVAQKAVLASSIVGMIAAIASTILVAQRNANALNREINKLVSQRKSEAFTLVSDFEKLAESLKDAKEGSQDYRDAISALNNKYSEYLPNLLNEKNALDEIAKSQDRVKNSILGRAKAYVYEEGMRKINEKAGATLNDIVASLTESFNTLGSTGMQRYTADFMSQLIDNLKSQANSADFKQKAFSIYKETFSSFYGREWDANTEDKWGQAMFGRRINQLASTVQEYVLAEASLNRSLEALGGERGFSSAADAKAIAEVEEIYSQEERRIRSLAQSADKTTEMLKNNEINKLNALIKKYEELNAVSNDGTYDFKIKSLNEQLDNLKPEKLTWLQSTLNNLFSSENFKSKYGDVSREYQVKGTDSYMEYIDKLQNSYKGVYEEFEKISLTLKQNEKYIGSSVESEKKAYEGAKEEYELVAKRKELLELIAKELGINITEKLSADDKKDNTKAMLQSQISTIKDLMKWADKFKELGVSDNDINKFLKSFFPDESAIIDMGNFEQALLTLADALAVYDEKAAKALRDDISGHGIESIVDRLKSAQDAGKKLRKILSDLNEDSLLTGTGVEFDVSKVISDYNKKMKSIADEEAEAFKAYFDATSKGNTDVNVNDFISQLMAWKEASTQNALTTAKDSIAGLANAFLKSWAEMNGINLSSWSKLTIQQLKDVRKAFADMFDAEGNIKTTDNDMFARLQDALKDYPELYEMVVEGLRKSTEEEQSKLSALIDEKKLKLYKQTAEAILKLNDALQEYADVSSNDQLGETTEAVADIASVAKSVIAGFTSGGWIGAAIALVAELGTRIVQDATEAERLKNAIADARVKAQLSAWDDVLGSGSASIFGSDTFTDMSNAMKVLDDVTSKIGQLNSSLASQDVSQYWVSSYLNPLGVIENKVDSLLAKVLGFQANLFSREGGNTKALEEAMEKGYKGIETYIIKTRDRNGLMNSLGFDDQYKNLRDAMKELGYEMYDMYGNINAEGLQAILDTYKNLSDADKQWMTEAISYSQEYEKAVKQMEEAVSELVSDVADNVADKLIDQWVEARNAALDYTDILNEVARAYARMALKNVLTTQIFDEKFEKDLLEYTKTPETTAKAVSLIEDALKKAQERVDVVKPILEALDGFMGTGTSESLSTGIKSVTEDTASLLASYINGMRADLAAQRIDVQGISADVKVLLGLVPSSMSLENYLTKIEANTYDTAQNTRVIMDNINAVMTNASGESALRVYM